LTAGISFTVIVVATAVADVVVVVEACDAAILIVSVLGTKVDAAECSLTL
jgi:hypothetical protein